MRIIGGHNTDYRQVNAINGIISPDYQAGHLKKEKISETIGIIVDILNRY